MDAPGRVTVPLKIRVRRKLPSRRVSVSLPGELYAKLELYQRLLGEGVGANDVIAEALRVCFESDRAFRRAWDEESARRTASTPAEAPRPSPTGVPSVPRGAGLLADAGDKKGLLR